MVYNICNFESPDFFQIMHISVPVAYIRLEDASVCKTIKMIVFISFKINGRAILGPAYG